MATEDTLERDLQRTLDMLRDGRDPRAELPPPTLSAIVERGVTTNRVRTRAVVKAASAGTAKRRYRKDPTTRGLDTAVVCISLPVAELVALDDAADQAQMARSHFIREAVRMFAAARRGGGGR